MFSCGSDSQMHSLEIPYFFLIVYHLQWIFSIATQSLDNLLKSHFKVFAKVPEWQEWWQTSGLRTRQRQRSDFNSPGTSSAPCSLWWCRCEWRRTLRKAKREQTGQTPTANLQFGFCVLSANVDIRVKRSHGVLKSFPWLNFNLGCKWMSPVIAVVRIVQEASE